MSEELLICTAVTLALKTKSEEKRKLRLKWAKDWLLKPNNPSHINLLKERKSEPGDWYIYLRMDSEAYLDLLQKVTPRQCNETCYHTTWTTQREPPIPSDRKKLLRPEMLCCSLTASTRNNYSWNVCSNLWGAEARLSQSKLNFLTMAYKYLKQHTTTPDAKKQKHNFCLFRFSYLQRKVNGYL